ncbi:MAG: hypothetical protein LUH09_05600 [Clostridiales bacterium]|nr:hypothetical protein [Clostridiales bacterium]
MKTEYEKPFRVVNHTKDGGEFSSVRVLDYSITKALIEKIGLAVFVSKPPSEIIEGR